MITLDTADDAAATTGGLVIVDLTANADAELSGHGFLAFTYTAASVSADTLAA